MALFAVIWDANGDMGDGQVVGPFPDHESYDRFARKVWDRTEDAAFAGINVVALEQSPARELERILMEVRA